ncbi:replication-associated recombination protein A [Mycoplasma corogypsi]|uniref:replication-associated recombination protein A n=1 Tax=Mycoplasma corogypsi TaxID=2106 RepID=UPI00387380FD
MNKNLANQIRPSKISDLIGQDHIKKILQAVVKNNITSSFLFYGESGIGKTTAAFALANQMQKEYGYFNASVDSKADLVKILETKQIIIIDEIHRLNKDKQDILLSYLEFDKIIVYATTTENPYFKVVPAVRSRMQILQFNKLTEAQIVFGLRQIINQQFPKLLISDERLYDLASFSAGDYRLSINNLQMLAFLATENVEITKNDLKTIIPNINFYSDLNSQAHYNNLSALHKSLRGSDVDASLYYGLLILKSGDLDGLFRRMLCVAYEDIGVAAPMVGVRVETAIRVFERLGVAEGVLPIGFALIDLALAPKSNSAYMAIQNVNNYLDNGKIYEIPKHLRDSHYASASKLGDGVGYLYPHDYQPYNYVKQQYLPNQIKDVQFYFPGTSDMEQKIKQWWNKVKNS